jgi:hypothetical protein
MNGNLTCHTNSHKPLPQRIPSPLKFFSLSSLNPSLIPVLSLSSLPFQILPSLSPLPMDQSPLIYDPLTLFYRVSDTLPPSLALFARCFSLSPTSPLCLLTPLRQLSYLSLSVLRARDSSRITHPSTLPLPLSTLDHISCRHPTGSSPLSQTRACQSRRFPLD